MPTLRRRSSHPPSPPDAIPPAGAPSSRQSVVTWAERVFINRNYGLFMVGAFISATGGWSQSVALGWLVLELGNSEFLLGLTNFAAMVPLLLLSVPAGALVDRFDHKKLLLIAQIGTMAANSILAVATLAGVRSVPLILITALAGGLFNAIGWPTWSVFINDLVPASQLRSAVALNSARFNLTRVIGPAIAGVLLAAWGAGVCFAIAAASSIAVIASVIAIKLPSSEPRPPRPWLAALKEGLYYCWTDRTVRNLLLLTTVVGFFIMPYQAFLPSFVRDTLGLGPEALGFLLTSVGAGAILGATLSGSGPAGRRPDTFMISLMALSGAALVAFSFTRTLPASMSLLPIVGLACIGYLAMANATLQITCPQALLGRVMGVWTVVNAGMQPVGSLVMGAAAEQISLPQTFLAAGAITAVVGLAVMVRRRLALRAP